MVNYSIYYLISSMSHHTHSLFLSLFSTRCNAVLDGTSYTIEPLLPVYWHSPIPTNRRNKRPVQIIMNEYNWNLWFYFFTFSLTEFHCYYCCCVYVWESVFYRILKSGSLAWQWQNDSEWMQKNSPWFLFKTLLLTTTSGVINVIK